MKFDYNDLIEKIDELQKENDELKLWQGQVMKLISRLLDSVEDEKNK